MAKFIKLISGGWLNINTVELMHTEMSTWRRGNKPGMSCKILAVTSDRTEYKIFGVTETGTIPEGKEWEYSEVLENLAHYKLEELAEWLAVMAALPSQPTVCVPEDMRDDLIRAMNAVVNNTQAEGAKECE